MKAESRLKQKVLKDLRAIPRCYCVKIQQVAIRGVPDILACISGEFVALELKASEDAPITVQQELHIDQINKAYGHAYVVHPANWAFVLTKLIGISSIKGAVNV